MIIALNLLDRDGSPNFLNYVNGTYLVGAGEAAPDAVLDETPLVVRVVVVVEPTDSRDGRGVVVLVIRRVGIRDGVASSVLSNDSVDP